jgi:hypothetical protein
MKNKSQIICQSIQIAFFGSLRQNNGQNGSKSFRDADFVGVFLQKVVTLYLLRNRLPGFKNCRNNG